MMMSLSPSRYSAPAQAMPLTAAMTGFHKSFSFGLMLIPGSLYMKGVLSGPARIGSRLTGLEIAQVALLNRLLTVDPAAERLGRPRSG